MGCIKSARGSLLALLLVVSLLAAGHLERSAGGPIAASRHQALASATLTDPYTTGQTGADVSFPQCPDPSSSQPGGIQSFPTNTGVGVVGVNYEQTYITPANPAYDMVAADGGIFSFGDATFYGSMGGTTLNAPVMGMALSPDGKGYWLVGNDGGVFTFGDAVFHGSLGAQLPNTPINGILSAPGIDGYWLLSPDSLTYSFTPTPNERLLPASTAIVNAAASQIGPATQANFCNPYGPCEEWCALFAAWAWDRGGIPAVSDGFTGDLYQWAATHTSVISANQTPAAGDIVFYGTGPQNTETSVHDGIVVQTWPDGSLITVEGDSGPGPAGWLGVTVNGPFQAQRSIEANGDPIYGYGEPS